MQIFTIVRGKYPRQKGSTIQLKDCWSDLNRKGKIENRFIIDYKAAMSAREDADYHYSYSMGTAEHDLKICKEFLDMAEKLLKKI